MGTRARIGLLTQEDVVRSIYTHWDGYTDHHGPILLEAFDTPEKITALLDLGDLSVLGREIGEKHDFDAPYDGEFADTCRAYGRDRGEEGIDSRTHRLDEWPDYGQEFEYLFRDGAWLVREGYSSKGEWKDLAVAVGLAAAAE